MAFGDKPCLDTSTKSFVNPLVHHMYYSYNGCIRECKEKYILDQCGCRDYTHLGMFIFSFLVSALKMFLVYLSKTKMIQGSRIRN